MQKEHFDKLMGFLLGASWAIVLFGALITFNLFLYLGLSLSLFFTIIFIVLSMFFIMALDAFVINRKRLEEAKKQTKLLEKLYSKHTK